MGQILRDAVGEEVFWQKEFIKQWLKESVCEQFKWIKAKICNVDIA